jgi:hypothetical protein
MNSSPFSTIQEGHLEVIISHTLKVLKMVRIEFLMNPGKWYNFNDSDVSEITEDEVRKAFGGEGTSSTGYMLIYRKY